jgi:biopolymer transport protein ExbB
MSDWIVGCGVFIYPLGACSLLAVWVFLDRFWGLRREAIFPSALPACGMHSVAGRIFAFWKETSPDRQALKAYVEMELVQMERGLFLLEAIVAGAPLLGLLGTVTGLVKVFLQYGLAAQEGPTVFAEGISLALVTTIVGLVIAIPALLAHSYLLRRVDWWASQLSLEVEKLPAKGPVPS